MKFTKKVKQQWIDAMKSGDYKQASGDLQKYDEDGNLIFF